jgi:hypothetical protein
MDVSMQPALATFLVLLLAHLLADFPFQTDWIAARKGSSPSAMLAHIAVHYVTAWGCLLFFLHSFFFSVFSQLVVAAYISLHLAIDVLKHRLVERGIVPNGGAIFLLDQVAHVATAAGAAIFLSRGRLSELLAAISPSPKTKSYVLAAAIVYISVIFGGGYLIRILTKGLARNTITHNPDQLKNAGLYIGWIERFLVLTAVAVQSPALVGLILTGKSIARFPELKEPRFAEYFLIGTLLSISFAVAGGLVLARITYGTFSLK